MSQNYSFTTYENNILDITTYGNSNLEHGNCIVFVHGFKGFKDWGFGPYLADYFSKNGYFVITFNFSHNGIGPNSVDFNELDKFANNYYSLEIREILEIISAYRSNFFGNANPNGKIGIIGHSRGGGDAIIASSLSDEISALVTWSAISKFDRFTERQKIDWKNKGYIEMLNARTKQLMRLNRILLEDIENNSKDYLNIKKALQILNKPYLIIHGEQDLAVPISEAEDLYKWSNKDLTEFYRIKGTGHTFDIKHPFIESSKSFESVLDKTLSFFNNHLNNQS